MYHVTRMTVLPDVLSILRGNHVSGILNVSVYVN